MIQEEIRLIIEKNLSKEVGDTLKKVLEQATQDSETVKTLQASLDRANKEKSELNARIQRYEAFDKRNAELEVREKAVAEKERQHEIETLKVKLSSEVEKALFCRDVAMGLVRNTEYRKSLHNTKSSNDSSYGNGGSTGSNTSENTSSNENKGAF